GSLIVTTSGKLWPPDPREATTSRKLWRSFGDSSATVAGVLGLPSAIRVCLFDLDGVLTPTAAVHAAAWKELFDDFLRERAARTGEPFVPFDPVVDYDEYVDGKPRADGTRSFLASRGIALPEGEPDDPPKGGPPKGGPPKGGPPEKETVEGLSARKDEVFL